MCPPIKQSGMTLLRPSSTAKHAFTTSRLSTRHATAAVQADTPYRHGTAKEVALLAFGEFERQTIKRGAHTGVWLNVMPTHDNGMMLSLGEW